MSIGKKLDCSEKEQLQKEVGEIMPLIPGKNIANTMQHIDDGCDIYMNGEKITGAFVDARLYQAAPKEAKAAWNDAICALLKKHGIDGRIYLNITEKDEWGSDGGYK